MVAHTAKATEGKKVSARGAGAFKGDVQQLVLIYKDATLNWLIMDLSDKARGELDGYTYVLNKRTQEVMVRDELIEGTLELTHAFSDGWYTRLTGRPKFKTMGMDMADFNDPEDAGTDTEECL
ncbi:hypothetical protein N9C27_00015 [Luminiphilus sp.]|nr:hypothetical protein [Luminiphilus sp.]